ncbi:MAG TPA: DUF6505 family protein [Beijerinckiaceae bacterium]|jgi:hypothetical protein
MLKLPRTLRLDPSDTFVFEHAAEPGEWAVPGSFLFWDVDLETMPPKRRAAFRAGFLGLSSFGFSTLVVVSEARADEREAAVALLSRHLTERFGAPDEAAARAAAEEEIAFATSLCHHPEGTVLALHRSVEEGAVRERFRTLQRREPAAGGADRLHAQARAFEFVEVEDEPEERVDLAGLIEGEGRR